MLHCKNFSLENIVDTIDGVTYVEEWRPVLGYEGIYEISSFGRLKRLSRYIEKWDDWNEDIILATSAGKKKQYLKVSLRKDGKPTSISVHRLVGLHFLPIIDGKPHINHKTGVKTDNHYSQLEWCTPQENNEHGVAMGLLKRGITRRYKYVKKGMARRYKKIVNIVTGEQIGSSKELSNKLGISVKDLRRMLSGERLNRTSYRYIGQENVSKPKKERVKPLSPVAIFDMDWNFQKSFDYSDQAAKYVGCEVTDINDFLKGRRAYVKGCKFKRIGNDGKFVDGVEFISKKLPVKPKRIPQPLTPANKIIKYDLSGNKVDEFGSLGEFARAVGTNKSNLRRIIKGKEGREGYYKGFIYKYA